MTWYVKSRATDGKVTSTLMDDFKKAMELRREFETKGIYAWVEDVNGQLVGFSVISDPVITSP